MAPSDMTSVEADNTQQRPDEAVTDRLRRWWVAIQFRYGKGQGLVDYSLVLLLVSTVTIAVLTAIGGRVTGNFFSAVSGGFGS